MSKVNRQKIPRPLNCFMIFRLEKQSEIVARCPGANHRDISKIIAKWWREASEQEKQPYKERARLAKIAHAREYPDYKYAPQKKAGRTRKYTIQSDETFTSKNHRNNQLMQRLYEDRSILNEMPPVSSESSPNQHHAWFTPITCDSSLPSGDGLTSSSTPCATQPDNFQSAHHMLFSPPYDSLEKVRPTISHPQAVSNDFLFVQDPWLILNPSMHHNSMPYHNSLDQLPMTVMPNTMFSSMYPSYF